MRADHFVRPTGSLDMGNGGIFVGELGGEQIGVVGHGYLLCPPGCPKQLAKSSI
jgi:hypothetical protein